MSDLFFKLKILSKLLRCAFSEWRSEVWGKDLDASYCCSGYECGCHGASVRDVYDWNTRR